MIESAERQSDSAVVIQGMFSNQLLVDLKVFDEARHHHCETGQSAEEAEDAMESVSISAHDSNTQRRAKDDSISLGVPCVPCVRCRQMESSQLDLHEILEH